MSINSAKGHKILVQEITELREWIKWAGDNGNICTWYVLGEEVCSNCKCGRKQESPTP